MELIMLIVLFIFIFVQNIQRSGHNVFPSSVTLISLSALYCLVISALARTTLLNQQPRNWSSEREQTNSREISGESWES